MTNDELKALCESNARSIEANSGMMADLARTMIAFRDELRSLGTDLRSWVETHNQISDDQGGELTELSTADRAHNAQVTAIRDAANTDRQSFREQAEADRQEFRAALEADRAEWRASFEAARQDSERSFEAARQDSERSFEAARQDSNQRFEAMQENLQRLFLEVRSTNGAVAGLSDRVDNLEQAS